jgi:WD40 repeat protein
LRALSGAGYWIVSSVAFAAAGRSLVVGYGGENLARVWDVESGRDFARLPQPGGVEVVSGSPVGDLLATAGGSGVTLWDPVTWESRLSLKVSRAHVRRLAFHPAGAVLATAGDVPAVTLWDTATGRRLARFDWQIGKVLSLAFAPDGMTAAAGGSSGRIAIWDVDEVG